MKECLNQDKIAARAATLAPEADAGPKLVEGVIRARESRTETDGLRSEAAAFGTGELKPTPSTEQPPLAEETASAQAPRAASAARLFDGITHASAAVRRFGADSVAIVLRPDSQTEISLNLAMREGKVEAVARCDRGDLTSLTAHWPELRQALDQHGVRLLDLQPRMNNISSPEAGLPGFSHQNSRQFAGREDSGFDVLPNSMPKAGLTPAAPALAGVTNNRLFESWA